MYERFLIPIDGSVHSMTALDAAIALVQNLSHKVEVTLLHVNHTPTLIDTFGETVDIEEAIEEEEKEILQPASEKLREAGIPFEAVTRKGEPTHEICEMANHGHYDMVIMGSRGLGRVTELVVGSVSRNVIQHAHCPVLVTK